MGNPALTYGEISIGWDILPNIMIKIQFSPQENRGQMPMQCTFSKSFLQFQAFKKSVKTLKFVQYLIFKMTIFKNTTLASGGW